MRVSGILPLALLCACSLSRVEILPADAGAGPSLDAPGGIDVPTVDPPLDGGGVDAPLGLDSPLGLDALSTRRSVRQDAAGISPMIA